MDEDSDSEQSYFQPSGRMSKKRRVNFQLGETDSEEDEQEIIQPSGSHKEPAEVEDYPEGNTGRGWRY